MIKKIIKFFKRLPKLFWAICTILLGIGTVFLAGIVLALKMTKEKVLSKREKKVKDRINENNKTVDDGRNYIDIVRDKYSN